MTTTAIPAGIEITTTAKTGRAHWMKVAEEKGWELLLERPMPQKYGVRLLFVKREG